MSDAAAISGCVLSKLRRAGAYGVFVTYLYSPAGKLSAHDGCTSLAAVTENGEATHRAERQTPEGISHARDVPARKHIEL